MQWIEELARALLSQTGIVSVLLLVGNAVLFRLYTLERKDRKSAEADLALVSKTTTETLSKLQSTLELIKDRLDRPARRPR